DTRHAIFQRSISLDPLWMSLLANDGRRLDHGKIAATLAAQSSRWAYRNPVSLIRVHAGYGAYSTERSQGRQPCEREHGEPDQDAVHHETDSEAAGAIKHVGRQNRYRTQSARIRKMTDRQHSRKIFLNSEYFRQNEREK